MSEYRSPAIRLSSFVGAHVYPILIPDISRACNPSIAVYGREFRAIVRTVNYELNDSGVLISLPGGLYVSSNWLVELDRELRITSARQIDDGKFRGLGQPFPGGFEDCRLFRWKDAWWFSATVVAGMTPLITKMVLCRLDAATVAECHFVSSPKQVAIEKNWMPCVADDGLRWIYRIDPMQLVHHRTDERPVHEFIGKDGRLENWSGSSQCVRYRSGWLCVVHRRVEQPEGNVYEHRFVELTDGFGIRRVSDTWIFERPSIEFCAGLCIFGRNLILSYGILDRRAHLLRIKLSIVERMLRSDMISRRLTLGSQVFGRWIRRKA